VASYTAFLLTTGIKTTGTVIEMREKRGEEDQTMFAPTFVFIDSIGNTNTVNSNTYSSPASYRVGQGHVPKHKFNRVFRQDGEGRPTQPATNSAAASACSNIRVVSQSVEPSTERLFGPWPTTACNADRTITG
jgi:hypothetical protein